MIETLKFLLSLLLHLLPFRIVWEWERGILFTLGRPVRACGPGLVWVWPLVQDVRTISVVPEVYITPLQVVHDLTFRAAVTVEVVDPVAAYTKLGHWSETVLEIASGEMAEHLRVEEFHGKSNCDAILGSVNAILHIYGLRAISLRFTVFTTQANIHSVLGVSSERLSANLNP